MTDQLRIDTDVLRNTGSQLRLIADEYVHANTTSDFVAEAVGDAALAESATESATEAAETFDRLESELAASIRGQDR